MAEFDANDYFARRSAAIAEEDRVNPPQSKLVALQRATAEKVRKLDQMAEAAQRQFDANTSSLVGQWGLDPDGILGQTVNLGANVYSGLSRGVGSIGALPASIMGNADLATLNQREIDAINRHLKGTATEEDVDLITSSPDERRNAPTPLQRYERGMA